jgi:hypothetical protein
MSIQRSDITLTETGKLVLDQLPFAVGTKVDVTIEEHAAPADVTTELHGTVLGYLQPFDGVDIDEWEAIR